VGRDEVGSLWLLIYWYISLTTHNRKVEGEAKGEAHGTGDTSAGGLSVPLRRWEDWERSRLRKIKREERRKRDMERLHPGGFVTSENDLLSTRGGQYEGSDAYSVTSSEEDQWGQQVGAYNEGNMQYPPPPPGLYGVAATGEGGLVGNDQLEAMLDAGFDEESPSHSPARTPISSLSAARYQLSDNPSQQHLIGGMANHTAMSQTPSTSSFTLVPHHQDVHNHYPRPREAYGPLGPLDPGEKF